MFSVTDSETTPGSGLETVGAVFGLDELLGVFARASLEGTTDAVDEVVGEVVRECVVRFGWKLARFRLETSGKSSFGLD